MCTAWLPVVPVVGAAPLCLCLVPLWHRVRCDVRVVCWVDAFTAVWSGIGVRELPFVARVALLACVGGLTFIVRVCLWWFHACLCIPNHHVSLSHMVRQAQVSRNPNRKPRKAQTSKKICAGMVCGCICRNATVVVDDFCFSRFSRKRC